ncbi:hypothetical protein [Helicobacter typhlonius]|uniref:hypothetical protein n=1 Tax=Helicobacter typhlonius TaxID=76936 RepID=UPI002FE07568
MGVGIFKKMKNAFKTVGHKLGNFAKNVVKNIPKVVDVGKKVVGAVKPILGGIPIVGEAVNAIDTGLNVVSGVGKIGRSIIDEVK